MKATLFAVIALLSFVTSPNTLFANPVINSPPITQKTIDLNKANVAELTQSIKGIGKKRAQAIVAYREAHGRFKSIAELANVKGLGETFVQRHLTELQAGFVIK
jgi:competence protein ComEA